MHLDAPIATGFTAEVYAWKQGWVLKLFNLGIPRPVVEQEAHLARLVELSGLPVPAVGEVVEIDGRFGVEYGRVEGVNMLQKLIQQPWGLAKLARQLAEIQAHMHQIKIPAMPSIRATWERKIKRAVLLPNEVRSAALDALERLAEQDVLCHGDFHPNNILLAAHGPVIIDWIDAARGSPILDVARSTLLFAGGAVPPGVPPSIKMLRGWFYHIYLKRYMQLNPINRRELEEWIPVAAAARLDENIHIDEERLLSLAKRMVQ
ncbi:MAG TPA: aminoglycoside phosphotransferase family protein [Anaerolineales bacterium]|nr:aminoglycoside phosphotransferase family protein [Anaerolineales bacterium]